ncbi:MAG: radical SAM protein [Desulfobacterales bacterium]
MPQEALHRFDFEIGMYRPPSEGGSYSLLLRVTRNCPWNRCEFCVMYKTEKFQIRPVDEVKNDIDNIAFVCGELKRISWELGYGGAVTRECAMRMLDRYPELSNHHGFFMVFNWLASGGKTAFLQDANSLIMKTVDLQEILRHLRRTFPSISRVTSYARSKTLAQRSGDELSIIHRAGLDRLHVGLETGDDTLLKLIKKGATSEDHIRGGRKAVEAGFQLSEYWMPGLGGKKMWQKHAVNTARVLNEINPHYIRSRPFHLPPGTPMAEWHPAECIGLLSPKEQLTELKLMIETLDVTSRVCFDHAGNYWRNRRGGLLFSQSYEGYRFPDRKKDVLRLIEEGLSVDQVSPMGLL